jgi:general stress protein YciG
LPAFGHPDCRAAAVATAKNSDRQVNAANDDYKTDGNPGLTKSRAAAREIGAFYAPPPFDRATGADGKDWNDHSCAIGAGSVKLAFDGGGSAFAGLAAPLPPAPAGEDISQVALICASSIKPKTISWIWPGWLARVLGAVAQFEARNDARTPARRHRQGLSGGQGGDSPGGELPPPPMGRARSCHCNHPPRSSERATLFRSVIFWVSIFSQWKVWASTPVSIDPKPNLMRYPDWHEDEMMTETAKKLKRGFASMDPEKQRAIARKGGESVPREKRSFSQNTELAAQAGRKGGKGVNPTNRSFARDRDLAKNAGSKGGRAAHASAENEMGKTTPQR